MWSTGRDTMNIVTSTTFSSFPAHPLSFLQFNLVEILFLLFLETSFNNPHLVTIFYPLSFKFLPMNLQFILLKYLFSKCIKIHVD